MLSKHYMYHLKQKESCSRMKNKSKDPDKIIIKLCCSENKAENKRSMVDSVSGAIAGKINICQ